MSVQVRPFTGGKVATMSEQLPSQEQWGFEIRTLEPAAIVRQLSREVESAIKGWGIEFSHEQCDRSRSHWRATVLIRLPERFVHQLMNGATGYRAHYAAGTATGERFNEELLNAAADLLLDATSLYADLYDRRFLRRSLLGRHSKFWFPKDLSDPSAQGRLLMFSEEICWPRWLEYWRSMEKPRKGLLAPVSEEPAVLLNGTFVDSDGSPFDQKPERSRLLFEHGWT
jgi:hypothetical protein